VAVFKGFAGNRKVSEFLLVAQWQFYREFAIAFGVHGVVVFLTELKERFTETGKSHVRL
jgi:hypothetical protein